MRVFLICIGVALASCAPSTQYIKADGQAVPQQRVEADRAECAAERDDRLCMVGKGYFLVSEEQAAAKSAQLAAIADENRRQAELAAQAEEAKRLAAARATKKKKKLVSTHN